jgi:hypothetical protein
METAGMLDLQEVSITIAPHGKHGKFAASLPNGERLVISVQPFIASARALLARGHDPETTLLMRHAGSETLALRGRIGAAALLEVEESGSGLRLRKASRTPGSRCRAALDRGVEPLVLEPAPATAPVLPEGLESLAGLPAQLASAVGA